MREARRLTLSSRAEYPVALSSLGLRPCAFISFACTAQTRAVLGSVAGMLHAKAPQVPCAPRAPSHAP